MSDDPRPTPNEALPAALGDVPDDVRTAERARLEALASHLYPTVGAAGSSVGEPPGPLAAVPRWFWWLAILGLGLGLVGLAARQRSRPEVPPGPAGSVAPPGSAGAVSPSGATTPASADATLPTAVESTRPSNNQSPAPGQGQDGAVASSGLAPSSPTAVVSGVAPTTAAPAGDAAVWPCPDVAGAAVAVPAGGGPWVLGRVVGPDCRPREGVVVALTASGAGPEFLARSEADGSYALAVEPGLYRAELVEARGQGWQDRRAAGPGPVELSVAEADSIVRLDFLLEGGGP